MNFVAHRGFPALFPENTIPAFEAVMRHPECGKRIVGIENDIRLTADGEMAVFHDDAVEFRGVKTQVDRLALSELSEAVSIRFGGVKVPTLDEFFDCVGHKLELLVELKDGAYDKRAFMDSLDASIRRFKPNGELVLHSFSAELMRLAVERFKGRGLRFGALAWNLESLKRFPADLLDEMESVHPYWENLVREEKGFAALGKPLNVWTVNRKHELRAMEKLECQSILRAVMTDDLRLLETP